MCSLLRFFILHKRCPLNFGHLKVSTCVFVFSPAACSPSTSALTAATHCTAASAFARTSLISLRRTQFQLREQRNCWRMQLKEEFKTVARSEGSAGRSETEAKMRAGTSERNSCVTVCGQARTQRRRGSTTRNVVELPRRPRRLAKTLSVFFRDCITSSLVIMRPETAVRCMTTQHQDLQ